MSHHAPNGSNTAPARPPGNQAPVTTGSISSTSSSKLEISKEKALSWALGVRSDVVHDDIVRCLTVSCGLEIEQGLVIRLIKHPKVQEWLRAPTSQVLLINGNLDGHAQFSPVTCLSARLLYEVGGFPPVLRLHFFCAQHRQSPATIMDDAAGMLKCFIVELLERKFAWDLTFLDRSMIERIDEGSDVGVLFNIFKKMLLQLPGKTYVFCIIDNISESWSYLRRQEFVQAIGKIRKMAMDESRNLIIKVLLTCHGESLDLKDCIKDKETLAASAALRERHEEFTENGWQCATREFSNELAYATTSSKR